MRRALRILVIGVLLIPLSALTWLSMTESGLHWAFQTAKPYLPGQLSMNTLEGRLMGTIIIKGLEYRQTGILIKADELSMNWSAATLLTTTVDISRLHVRSLSIHLPKTIPQTKKPDQPLTLPDISLPWRVVAKDVVVDGVKLKQNDQTFTLEQIRLNASSLFSQLDIDELTIRAESFSLTVEGEVQLANDYPHKLDVRWQTKFPSNAVIKGNGKLVGNLAMTQLKQRTSGPLQLSLDAKLTDLLDQFNWQAKAIVTAIEVDKLAAGWPAATGKLSVVGSGDLTTATLSGRLNGQYPELGPFNGEFELQRLTDNRIQLDHLNLTAPNTDMHLYASGQWQPGNDGGSVTLATSWQNVRWPLKDGAWFDSVIGSGWIEGKVHQYRVGLATDRPWPQAPPSFWYASADGNLDGLQFHSLRITALEGETLAKGQLNWSPQLTWQAQASVTDIDPSQYLPMGAEWPGKLFAKLTSSGRYVNGQVQADADITQLSGKLRGYPVSLRSRLSWRNAGLDIHSLDFQSGKNQINAQGRIGETLRLDWSIAATDLAEVFPQAQGKLSAKGLLTGPRSTPTIKATVKGKSLIIPDYSVGDLDGDVNVNMHSWDKTNIKLTANSLVLKEHPLQALTILASERNIIASASSEDFSALLKLNGEMHDHVWQGHIQQADLSTKQFNKWKLKSPTELHISTDRLEIKPVCWSSSNSDICTKLQMRDHNWQMGFDFKQVPLTLFSPWMPTDMNMDGIINAKADIQSQADHTVGEVNVQLPPGSVTYSLLEGEQNRREYRNGSMTISLTEKGISTRSQLTMNNGDSLKLKVDLPGADLFSINPKQQPLSGEGHLIFHDLDIIEALLSEVQNPQGEVALNFTVDGTLAQPGFSGRAILENGSFSVPRLGLKIKEIKLTSQIDSLNKLRFQLDARSGDGSLAIQGKTILDRYAGWPTEIRLSGKEFEVAHIPEAQVLVSPDLLIKLEKNTIDIKGDVHIPIAKLQPKDLTTAARASNDVIIVGGEKVADKKWSIFSRVRLTLGERVNFYGFGFEGRFGGSLLLVDEPGQLTKATGELSVPEGRYRAYGQRLDIENGRVLYTGGPLSNPGLNLRATRKVNNVIAGLNVRGSLNQPQIELFSIPAMGQTDALSYLMLGRPIENATGEEGAMLAKATLALGLSGSNKLVRSLTEQFGLDEMRVESSEGNDQASLVMGRYLSPKLYVSYGVGLIEAFNTFTVRYQISDKWQLKGESGEYHGADIFYTIER